MKKIGTVIQMTMKNRPGALYLGENNSLAADIRFAKRFHTNAKVLDIVQAEARAKYNKAGIVTKVEPIVLWED